MRESKIKDVKDIWNAKERQKAFMKRYGKDVRISVSFDINTEKFTSMDDVSECTMRFESKDKQYSITEFLKNGDTEKVILCYMHEGKLRENQFKRYIDAEVTLADKISEE